MKTIKVSFKRKICPIYIAFNLLNTFNFNILSLKNKKIMIITNDKVGNIYLNKIYSYLKKYFKVINHIMIPDGENFKNLSTANIIFTELIKKLYGRNTILIALGGGVICDITGFVAATYQRGVKFIQIPTTLLSQVDAAIGGKNGVNHLLGKNMIGTFYQPDLVLIDPIFLNSLEKREIISGMAEVIKYGIIYDLNFFIWLQKNVKLILSLDKLTIEKCIYKCCDIKIKIVKQDENELGVRAFLNLGHTYGHAIETFTNYNRNWLHGEAVAVGIIMASYTSLLMNKLKKEDFLKIYNLLIAANLPVKGPKEMKADDYLNIMIHDKKIKNKFIRLILPINIGQAKIFEITDNNVLIQSIQSYT